MTGKRRIIELAALILFTIIIIILSGNPHSGGMFDDQDTLVPVAQTALEYGIPVDSMVVIKDKVKKNEFLSQILQRYGVPYQVIDKLVNKSRSVFDVRRIRAGNNYTLLLRNDSSLCFQVFIYEISPTSYIVYDVRDSIHIHKGEKEIMIRELESSGTISSSLWNAMVSQNTDPNLANELSEVYAWAIDFFGLQKGDTYSVIYEALYVDDEYIGIGKVRAALFNHAGSEFWAFYFVQDSVGDYFDEKANSLRRTFLKAPLKYSRISSRFSNSRLHPVLKIRRPHHGVDYAAPAGTPVYAVGDGVVIKAGRSGQSGNMVKIRHNGTYTTAYLHLSGYAKGIREGVYVHQGDVIGYVGSTGLSTGPHLDFRFYRNGSAVDPLRVESPPAEPVDSVHRERYFEKAEGWKNMLKRIPESTKDPLITEVR
ncbi:MAG: peptidoglycan DD-metalloendopeptidase family protein [Bacteroidales bacterium]|nr:peptidoglycan DD-metalloendopeptidase family protein [Bacteroidales bacterium]